MVSFTFMAGVGHSLGAIKPHSLVLANLGRQLNITILYIIRAEARQLKLPQDICAQCLGKSPFISSSNVLFNVLNCESSFLLTLVLGEYTKKRYI